MNMLSLIPGGLDMFHRAIKKLAYQIQKREHKKIIVIQQMIDMTYNMHD